MYKKISLFFICLFLAASVMSEETAQNRRPRVALVLGGGAARGFAHIAVLEIIEELGIPIDMIAGVSSGAIVGGLYAVGYSPAGIMEAMEGRNWTSLFQDQPVPPFPYRNERLPLFLRIGSSAGFITPDRERGYSTGQKAYDLFKSLTVKIPSYYDFDKLPIPFRAGTVEVPSGKFRLLGEGDIAEAIRASMSIQGVFEPFIIDGHNYTDGGLLNNLPIKEVRDMGYDIVIGVDLFVLPNEYKTTPLDLPDLMLSLYFAQTSKAEHSYAEAVLFPLPDNVSMIDFSRGKEVYNLAKEKRQELLELLEPVRMRLAVEDSSETSDETSGETSKKISRLAYSDMQSLKPQRMIIKGALPRDRSFLEREFSHQLKNRELDEKNISRFLEYIYETGTYRNIIIRTDTRSGETCLEIDLRQAEENKFLIKAGLDFEGTFSSRSSIWSALRGGVEFHTKYGLSMLLEASAMDELSVGFSLLWPFGPHFFISAETDLVRDQEMSVEGIFGNGDTALFRLFYFSAAPKAGWRFNRNNSLVTGFEYFLFYSEDTYYGETGFTAAYTYNSLNNSLFATRGFHFRIENHLRLTIDAAEIFDLAGTDITGYVPLGQRFSLGISGYGSLLIGDPLIPSRLSSFRFEKTGRIYFPHAVDSFLGENTAIFSLSFQYEPMENLSLVGGRMLFLMAASAGGCFKWNSLEDFGTDSIIWNLYFGAALVPAKTFGVFVRAGAGGGNGSSPAPFISLDVGLSRFQKSLF